MFKSIVWATDGSESADLALGYAKSLAQESGASLAVIHCDEFLAGRGGGQPLFANAEDVKAKIDRQAHELRDQGLDATLTVVSASAGSAAHAIADAAEEIPADLIVVGSRGHTPLAGLVLGGVVQRLLHIAQCPVFVVPVKSRAAKEQGTPAAAEASA